MFANLTWQCLLPIRFILSLLKISICGILRHFWTLGALLTLAGAPWGPVHPAWKGPEPHWTGHPPHTHVAVTERGSCRVWLNGDIRSLSQRPPCLGGAVGPGQSPLPEPGSLPPRPGPAGTRTLHSQAGAQPRERSRPGAPLPSPHRRAGAGLIGQINFQFQRLLSPAMQPLGGGGLAGPLLSRAAFLALRAGRRHAQPGAGLRAGRRGAAWPHACHS